MAAMVQHVYPDVTPAELRHFEVMVDRQAPQPRMMDTFSTARQAST